MWDVSGCGKKETETHKPPIEVKLAEMADSTALDAASVDTAVADSLAAERDSM
jgi:hypothetical protein